QLRSEVAAPSLVIQPSPDEVARTAVAMVTPLMESIVSIDRTIADQPAPQRWASAIPTNPSATTVGSFTSAEPVTRTVPSTNHDVVRQPRGLSTARSAKTSPIASIPIISD